MRHSAFQRIGSLVLTVVMATPACKPKGAGSDLNAITGTDSDGKRKAFSLIPIKPVGMVSPVTVASLGMIQCGGLNGGEPETLIRTLEIIGAVGQLFYDGKTVSIPKSTDRLMRGKDGEMLQDSHDTMPVADCQLVGGAVPYSYGEVSIAANRLAGVIKGAKDFDDVQDDYLTAQAIFLAMRGATEMGADGKAASLDGAPLLAQLEIMAGVPSEQMAINMRFQDAYFNPCIEDEGNLPLLAKAEAKHQYFSCGKPYTANGKTFRHYEVGGRSKAYTYAQIRDRLAGKLANARKSRDASKKSASLTGGFNLLEGEEPAATDTGGTTGGGTGGSAPASAAEAPVSTGGQSFESQVAVMKHDFKAENLQDKIYGDRVTGDSFVATTDAKTLFEGQAQGNPNTGQVTGFTPYKDPNAVYGNRVATTDGNQWTAPNGAKVNMNADGTLIQQFDAAGNLQNMKTPTPSTWHWNIDPKTNAAQLMDGNTPVGAAMPARPSADGKYLRYDPKDQQAVVTAALARATTNGQVDPNQVAQINTALQTGAKVSFYRNKDGSLNEGSFGNTYNLFNDAVAKSNVAAAPADQKPVVAAVNQPTAVVPADPKPGTEEAQVNKPGDTRNQVQQTAALTGAVSANDQLRKAVLGFQPDPRSGQAGVDPNAFKSNAAQLDQGISAMEAELQKVVAEQNKVLDPTEMKAADRARSDYMLTKQRELQTTLDEMKKLRAAGEGHADRMLTGSGVGTGANQSSFNMAYQGLEQTQTSLSELQQKAATQLRELNQASLGAPIESNPELKARVDNQKAMVEKQIDDLAARRARIQNQIRDLRTDPANSSRVASLETSLMRTQDEIVKRQKAHGAFPYYYPTGPLNVPTPVKK